MFEVCDVFEVSWEAGTVLEDHCRKQTTRCHWALIQAAAPLLFFPLLNQTRPIDYSSDFLSGEPKEDSSLSTACRAIVSHVIKTRGSGASCSILKHPRIWISLGKALIPAINRHSILFLHLWTVTSQAIFASSCLYFQTAPQFNEVLTFLLEASVLLSPKTLPARWTWDQLFSPLSQWDSTSLLWVSVWFRALLWRQLLGTWCQQGHVWASLIWSFSSLSLATAAFKTLIPVEISFPTSVCFWPHPQPSQLPSVHYLPNQTCQHHTLRSSLLQSLSFANLR